MKKVFTLMVVVLMAATASAGITPYKNLYVEAYANPTGAGTVYLEPKNGDDANYLVDCSDNMGESAFIKLVFAENGGGGDYTIGCNKGLGVFEVMVDALPEAGYELVCLADKVTDDGVYGPDDCYPSIEGDKENERTISFFWTGQDIININVPKSEHDEDGTSANDTPSREDCAKDLSKFHETPDTYVYAIFREIGADLPMFDENKSTGIRSVNTAKSDKAYYSITGQQLSAPLKGINIINGRKVVVR